MQECHNNHSQVCLLSTTISRRLELETRGFSQIKREKNIFPDLTYFSQLTYQKRKSITHKQRMSDMPESHDNHFQNCLLSTTISTPFELETHGWSQIQAEEKVLPDLTYFFTIDLFEVEIYCTYAKRIRIGGIQKKMFLRLSSYNHHFYSL